MIFHQPLNSKGGYSFNAMRYTDTRYDSHFHKNLELIVVLRGGLLCTVNRKEYRLLEGEMGLCLPYDIHSFTPLDDSEFWVLVFSEDYVRLFSRDIAGKRAEGFVFKPSEEVSSYLKKRLIDNPAPTVYTLKSCLYGVVEEYESRVRLTDKGVKDRGVEEIVSYIEKNHRGELTLSDLSAALGYDYNYTSRYFHRIFNMSFSDFLNVYRMETALRLLEDTAMPVTEIAYESGFSSIRNFNSVFKSRMNISPSAYRSRLKT